MVRQRNFGVLGELYNKILIRILRDARFELRTWGKALYRKLVQKYDVVFGIEPAGTGNF